MAGAIAIVLIIVVGIPVGLMMTGAVVAALLGTAAKDDAEARHEGSELVDLS